MRLKPGAWLGIDVGSKRDKVASFCLIESSGSGDVRVVFEKGPARSPYPTINTITTLLDDPPCPPWFLKPEIAAMVAAVVDRSALVRRWLASDHARCAVAIDAPVAFAIEGESERWTETACTQTFKTPSRSAFATSIRKRKVEYHRINTFWKCVGFAIYRRLAEHVTSRSTPSMERIAALTVESVGDRPRLRETFPSDVYKRANGREGTLVEAGRDVLSALVAHPDHWIGARGGCPPAAQTLHGLREIANYLRADLASQATRLCEMRRRGGVLGDLWDAFTCAFAVCCEDHGAARLHGHDRESERRARLRREGGILTVECVPRTVPQG